MKKPLIAFGLIVVLALGAWAWMQQRDKGHDGTLVLYGNVDIRQVSLAFDGSGRVADMKVDEGDAVKTGQVLATLDTRTLALQAEQAQAQIGVQQQNLLRLKNGARPQELAQARSGYVAAQADAERARKDLARLQSIAANTDNRGVSVQELDRARAAAQVADAQAAQKRDALRLTEIGPRKEDIAAAEAQLKASEAQLALLQHQVSQGRLVSPSNAVVRSRLLEPGDMATPQRPVYALAIT
ncbi:biotin/lipoyl-binding protein, partial [Nitrosomonas sp. GH22]